MRSTLALSVLAPIVHALVNPAPSATDAIAIKKLGDIGFTPKPTTAPFHPDLLRRQTDGTSILGYLAPDNTCGFVSGLLGAVKTCDVGQNCAAVVDEGFYTMGCCASSACEWYGDCIDYVAYFSSSACDNGCQQDANTIKCTAKTEPYCYGYSVPGMSMGFYSCDSITASTFAEFDTTYNGETDAQTWLALRQSDLDSLVGTSALESATTATGGLASAAKSSAAGTKASGTPSASSSASSSSGSSTSTPEKKTSIGPIIGGVVGGLVVIGAIVGGVLAFCLKKKKNKTNNATFDNNQTNMQQSQSQSPPNFAAAAAAGQDPRMSQYQQPPPPGQYQNNQPQYNQPQYNQPQYDQNTNPPNRDTLYSVAGKVEAPYGQADAKYGQGVTVTETPISTHPPVSPAPAYSQPALQTGVHEIGNAGPPLVQYAPSPISSPANDNRYSAPAPQGYQPQPGWVPQQPGAHPQHQSGPVPVELGNNYAVPSQHDGRPVFEAA